MDVFSTGFLNGVVQDLRGQGTFLLDRYFPSVSVSNTEEIYFDTVKRNRRLAPFVSPLVEGQIVERRGFQANSFRPAYVKDKRVFDANAPFKRAAGEQLFGSMTPAARMERLVAGELQDQQDMLKLRLEAMAAQVLTTGSATISGDKYETVVVNYGRDSSLTVALSGASEWGDTGIDPLADLETWQQIMLNLTGVASPDVIMDPKAWGLFRSTASVTSILERFNNNPQATLSPYGGQRKPGEAASKGSIGGFNISVYQNFYIDPADNTEKQMLPDYTVLFAAPEIEGYQAYGAIRDHDAGLIARESFTKSWVVQDPSVRYIMMQSAPLIIPYRPNASFTATVHA